MSELAAANNGSALLEKLVALLSTHATTSNASSPDAAASSITSAGGKNSSFFRNQFDRYIKPANMLPVEIRDFLIRRISNLSLTSLASSSSSSSSSSAPRTHLSGASSAHVLNQIIMQSSSNPSSIVGYSSVLPAEMISKVRFMQLSSSLPLAAAVGGGGNTATSVSVASTAASSPSSPSSSSLHSAIDGLFSSPEGIEGRIAADEEVSVWRTAAAAAAASSVDATAGDAQYSTISTAEADLEAFLTMPATIGQVLHAINAGIALASYDDIGLPDASRWPLGSIVEGPRETAGAEGGDGLKQQQSRLWTSKTWQHPDLANVSAAPLRQTPQMAIRGVSQFLARPLLAPFFLSESLANGIKPLCHARNITRKHCHRKLTL